MTWMRRGEPGKLPKFQLVDRSDESERCDRGTGATEYRVSHFLPGVVGEFLNFRYGVYHG